MENRPTPVLAPMLVVAAALIDGKNRILLQKRRFSSEHGGLWEFPGGKVEPGESCQAALVREIEEELEIALDPTSLVPAGFATAVRQGGREIVLLLYGCRKWRGTPEPKDAEELCWADAAAFTTLPMPPLDIELSARAIALL